MNVDYGDYMNIETYEAGQTIFSEGDASSKAFVVRGGHVELFSVASGAERLVARLGENQIFGEMGLVEETPRSLSARAVDRVILETVSHSEFVEMLRSKPQESMKYIRILFERLRHMNNQLKSLGTEVDHDILANRAQSSGGTDKTELHLRGDNEHSIKALGCAPVRVKDFPFLVGRRSSSSSGLDDNNLYIRDRAPYNISRNHFAIERSESGEFSIKDRGSYLGTIVNGEMIGGRSRGFSVRLSDGDNSLIAGSKRSPFRFVIEL